jgi:hypothetical protein
MPDAAILPQTNVPLNSVQHPGQVARPPKTPLAIVAVAKLNISGVRTGRMCRDAVAPAETTAAGWRTQMSLRSRMRFHCLSPSVLDRFITVGSGIRSSRQQFSWIMCRAGLGSAN